MFFINSCIVIFQSITGRCKSMFRKRFVRMSCGKYKHSTSCMSGQETFRTHPIDRDRDVNLTSYYYHSR